MKSSHDDAFIFQQKMVIPRPLEEVFAFFSDAANLQKITPPHLEFKILTPGPIEMGQGTLIDYRIKIRGIPFKWKTLIQEWKPPLSFTDMQLKGPYRQWIHCHTFEETPQGVLMTDKVTYRLSPFIPKKWINHWFVKPQITEIFQYRQQILKKIFQP